MRPSRLLVLTAAAAASLITLGAASATGREQAGAAEVRRIQAHFDSVLAELEARPVTQLGSDRAAHREALIAELRDYRDHGVFPHNYDFPGRAVPYFVDRETGTLCAVANLLAVSGRRDIVDRVARADNNVWVAQLATDTAFVRWLDLNGLTLAEAARIQMPYVVGPATPAEQATRSTVGIVAPVAFTTAAATAVWNSLGNADGHSRVGTVLGIVSGAAVMGIGTSVALRNDMPRALSVGSVAVGGLSLALSTRGIMRHRQLASAPPKPEQRAAAEVSVAPTIPLNGGGAGMTLSLRF
jgi:hypothetical protein